MNKEEYSLYVWAVRRIYSVLLGKDRHVYNMVFRIDQLVEIIHGM